MSFNEINKIEWEISLIFIHHQSIPLISLIFFPQTIFLMEPIEIEL